MRFLVPLVLVLLASSVQAQGLQIHAAVALDVQGDTQGMTRRPVVTSPDRYVWVGDVVLDLPPSSIQTVGLEMEEGGGTALSLWLSEEAGREFADLTERSIGQALAVVYQERVLIAPVVVSAIPNGLVMITGLDEDEATRLADALRQATDERLPDPRPAPPRAEPIATPPASVPVRGEPRPVLRPLQDTPEAAGAALAFVDRVAERNWRAVTDMLHRDARRVARSSALSMLSLDSGTVTVRSDGREGSFIASDVLGNTPTGRFESLDERDAITLYLAALDVIGAWGPPGPPRRVVGEIRDGDRVHVILSASGAESGVSEVSLVTLALDRGTWRPLLTQPQGF